tara:strand:+ start:386 stop:751 length:366 start_codon:yes stop_codon:yes gene_type:complete
MSDISLIRIDAYMKNIAHEQHDSSSDNLCSLLCADLIQSVRIHARPNVYILHDAAGGMYADEPAYYFTINEAVFVNRALLVGLDEYGDWADIELPYADDILTQVTFLPSDYINQTLFIPIC